MKKMVLFIIFVLAGIVAATTITTTGKGKVRFYQEKYSVGSSISLIHTSTYEDRVILEFDISGLSAAVTQVTFDMWYANIDDPATGIIDVYTYTGDGVVTANDFYAGTLLTSFVGRNDSTIDIVDGDGYIETYVCGYASIDITSMVLNALAANETYIGIRLSTETTDRYNIGSMCNLPNPVLTVIPEPATLCLLAFGGILLRRKRS